MRLCSYRNITTFFLIRLDILMFIQRILYKKVDLTEYVIWVLFKPNLWTLCLFSTNCLNNPRTWRKLIPNILSLQVLLTCCRLRMHRVISCFRLGNVVQAAITSSLSVSISSIRMKEHGCYFNALVIRILISFE